MEPASPLLSPGLWNRFPVPYGPNRACCIRPAQWKISHQSNTHCTSSLTTLNVTNIKKDNFKALHFQVVVVQHGLKNPAVEPGLQRAHAQETQWKGLRSCCHQAQKFLECYYCERSFELKEFRKGGYCLHSAIQQSGQHGPGVQAHSEIGGCLGRCDLALRMIHRKAQPLKVGGDNFRVGLCLCWSVTG
ncbi:UNVERIFIED_CONTAM: hypothetical protein FKN15_038366 [Acipenser sinensis]